MQEHLSDSRTYTKLKSDPTNSYKKINNKLINDWENKNLISPKTAATLKINNAQPPKIYGLPKVHKQNVPLRPIVSCMKSPLYNLSKFLAEPISKIINKNPFYIKNSFDLKTNLDNIQIEKNDTSSTTTSSKHAFFAPKNTSQTTIIITNSI